MSEVDTKNANYRKLRFETVADCMAELDRIDSAHNAGTLTTSGNWTAGQILAHLSAWIEYGYDGFPMKPPPFFVKWILKIMLKRMLAKGEMPSGSSIPGVEGGTFGQEEMETPAAIERYRAALLRMQSEPAIYDSPGFGKVSDEVRIKANLLHAQLHLGFISYPENG
ncbi:MAG: DUF1569 domain-containing protein [Planctomycetota bacterium]